MVIFKEKKIDVLSIGLFGLAVGALTLGFRQLGIIPDQNSIAIEIICLAFGGIVQVLAGIIDINYRDQLGGTALTMYGFFWTTVFSIKLIDTAQNFHWDEVLFLPIVFVYMFFSTVMIYLTAHRNKTLMILHIAIAITFTCDFMVKLGTDLHLQVGAGHIAIGLIALYHALGTLVNEYKRRELIPLGIAPLKA